MKVCKISAWAVFAVLLAVGCPLWAQITIEWDEIPHVLGTRWTKNFAYDVSVNLGTVGGPQTWTFTSQPMGPDSCPNIVFPVDQAPFHDSFPSANLVYMSLEGSDSAFLYMQLTPSFLSTLGISGTAASGVFLSYDPADTNSLPEHYNDMRHYYTSFTHQFDPNSYMVFERRGFEHVNAYGTVVIPYGSFPCLRFVLYDTLIQTMYYYGIPVMFDTVTNIVHQFVAENRSAVVCVFSEDGETNPYFTFATILERMTYFATGIDEAGNMTVGENAIRVHPNPFTESVTFTWTAETAHPAILDIYDIQGRVVQHVEVDAGKPAINWPGIAADGKRVPDGVYFYRYKMAEKEFTGKIVKTH